MVGLSSSGALRRIVVFGASGGIGHQVVEQALNRDREVTAFVRSPGKLTLSDPKLTVVAGELSDNAAVDAGVRGASVVISALGPSLDRRAVGMPLVDGTRNIVEAMRAAPACSVLSVWRRRACAIRATGAACSAPSCRSWGG